jgi:hypothetical protein
MTLIRLLYKLLTGQMKELENNREYSDEQITENLKSNDDSNNFDNTKGTNARYYLRQRKIDYNLLHTERSQLNYVLLFYLVYDKTFFYCIQIEFYRKKKILS